MRRFISIAACLAVAAVLVIVPARPAAADVGACGGLATMTTTTGFYFPLLGPKRAGGFLMGGAACFTDIGTKVLFAPGAMNGYCHLAYGRGNAFGAGPGVFDFQWIWVGAKVVFSGHLTGEGKMFPAIGESCLPTGPGADNFTIVFAASKIHIPVVPPPVKFPPALPAACPNPPNCPD